MAPPRKSISPQKPVEPNEQGEPGSIAYWMGRVDGSLIQIYELFEQYVKTNEQNWSDERDWRSAVDKCLNDLDNRLTQLEKRLSDSPEDDDPPETDGEKVITWKWVVEKALIPVITAIVIFILLEVIPHVVGAK
jgi:hypothetical protein